MSPFETVSAAYAAFGRNDGARNFTAEPTTFIDGGDHVVVLGRYRGTLKASGAALDAQYCQDRKSVV